jgi:hypothetical protein
MTTQLHALQQAQQAFIDLPSATNWNALTTAMMAYQDNHQAVQEYIKSVIG